MSLTDSIATEGDSGTTPLTFAVTLSGPSAQPVTVRYATADGSARAPDDYAASSGTLTFNPGETAKPVAVAVKGDTVNETDETFSLLSPARPMPSSAGPRPSGRSSTTSRPARGYWLVAADGGIFAFGDARFFGSTGNLHLNQPIVGMAATPTGNGYWLVAADGGIFAFGDAGFFGSTGNLHLNQPIVGMAATPTGKGYWFVASRRRHLRLRRRRLLRLDPATRPNQPIVGMAATPTGNGYWFVARDGGIFAFGDAGFGAAQGGPGHGHGRHPSGSGYWPAGGGRSGLLLRRRPPLRRHGESRPADRRPRRRPKGGGYWLVARDGGSSPSATPASSAPPATSA